MDGSLRRLRAGLRAAALALALFACTTPSPEFIWARAPHATVSVSGMPFKVYWTRTRAQAIRLSGYTQLPVELLQARALVAIERVTGCRVIRRSVRGNAVRTDARIACPEPA